MIGYRFYAEMPQAMKSKSGNAMFNPWTRATLRDMAKADVIALHESGECVAVAIEGNDFSYTWLASYDAGYLRSRTTRISEALARQLSPQLFAKLEG